MENRDQIFQELKASRKYKHLCGDTLLAAADWALARFDHKKAVKAAKKKLHQVYGAYLERINHNKIQRLIGSLADATNADTQKSIAVEIMKFHASTRERIPLLDRFYNDLFKRIGSPKRILDLACGLHPFALAWMDLEPASEYWCCDIDCTLAAMINSYFNTIKHHPVETQHLASHQKSMCFKAECRDILVSIPRVEADVVLLLKTLPCLEHQERGAAARILTLLKAKQVVVSFPARSLTGKARGMAQRYQQIIQELSRSLDFTYSILAYPNETVYILKP